ncbi:MAG: terminase [Spirochaetes bacterium]|nr:terminase [Spirochaetota bacterium]
MEREIERVWTPQPKQKLALECPADELFYGGAKGGGKSDFLLADFLRGLKYGSHHRGILFRRSYDEFAELQARAYEIYPKIGAVFHGHSLRKGSRVWEFPSGSTLKMRYLDRDEDVQHYQGHQYTWIGFDELSEWATDYCYIFMFSCARSPYGVPVSIRGSGNPGRPGHVWLKHRFIDNKEPYKLYRDPETEMYSAFIPAFLDDNPILMQKDPAYEKRLKALPAHLYRAFRSGDWDVFAGQAFEEFRRDLHVISPVPLDPSWFRFASFDWGYAHPFSIGWWATTHEGRMIRYREWYGCERGKHNVGIKMASREVARKSWAISVAEGCKDMVADPSIWTKIDEGPSIADNFAAAGWNMIKGNNDRVSGCARVHDYMKGLASDGRPLMVVFDTCNAWIRIMPVLIVDDDNPEDILKKQEDHPYDDTRYAAMSEFTIPEREPHVSLEILPDDVDEKNNEYDPLE